MTTALLRTDLIRDEGLRLVAYRDSRGIWTIGVGHNIEADPRLLSRIGELRLHGLTRAEAEALLDQDIAVCCAALDRNLPWWRNLDPVRQDALANMAFNLGVSKLLGFHDTLAALKAGRWADAAKDMADSAWADQVGARATRLETLILTGKRP